MNRKTDTPILETLKGNDVAHRIASIFYSALAVATAGQMIVNHGLLQKVLMMENVDVKENAETSELVAPTIIIAGWGATAVAGVGTVVRCAGWATINVGKKSASHARFYFVRNNSSSGRRQGRVPQRVS